VRQHTRRLRLEAASGDSAGAANSAKTAPDPSDARWRGADSRVFLRHVTGLMRQHGFVFGNGDVTIVCELPKIVPHAQAMRANLAADLGCGIDQLSVKATTSEKLGFAGRGEGIAALAVVLLLPTT